LVNPVRQNPAPPKLLSRVEAEVPQVEPLGSDTMPGRQPASAVFLDRDGTIMRDVHYCCDVRNVEILPGVAPGIKLLNDSGFRVVVATNQSGIGRGLLDEEVLRRIHQRMLLRLLREGAMVDAIYHCPHGPDDGCECRKPRAGLLRRAAQELGLDLERSFMVGDSLRDIEAGREAGCRTAIVSSDPYAWENQGTRPDFVGRDFLDVAMWIIGARVAGSA